MYSKNTPALNRVTPSKAKNRTQIFTNVNLAISANHKSNYPASFYTKKKPELFTASTNDKTHSTSTVEQLELLEFLESVE